MLGTTVATLGLDNAQTGSRQLVSGIPEDTLLNQSLQTLGLSPAADLLEMGTGLGVGAKASKLLETAPKITSQSQFPFLEGIESKPERLQVNSSTKEVSVSGYIGSNGSSIAESDFGYLPPLRQKYVQDVYQLKKEVNLMKELGHSPEDIARYASKRRNEIKKPILEVTPKEFLEKIKKRNFLKYKNETGPTIEQLREKGKTWEQIIDGATRAGGGDLF